MLLNPEISKYFLRWSCLHAKRVPPHPPHVPRPTLHPRGSPFVLLMTLCGCVAGGCVDVLITVVLMCSLCLGVRCWWLWCVDAASSVWTVRRAHQAHTFWIGKIHHQLEWNIFRTAPGLTSHPSPIPFLPFLPHSPTPLTHPLMWPFQWTGIHHSDDPRERSHQ